ncbi:MAG: transposase [Kiritimatiellae bacterium]|nr:transposase [Kiritimatiellia bacterium]
MTQSEREQYMEVVRERDMWREKYEREHAENGRLRKALGKVRRTALEKPFGEHTPSGKRLVKPSSPEPETEEERLRRRGGAKHGHEGHGWKRLGEPEETVSLPDPEACPHCHGPLVDAPFEADEGRDVVVARPVKAHVRRYVRRARCCPRCGKPVRAKVPGVMDGCRYANSVVARSAANFYLHGIPAGVESRTSGVGKNTLLGIFNRVAGLLKPVRERLLGIVRRADSRGAAVAKEALKGFTGLYLSDRYAGYAFLALRAFCLEHPRRDALKAADENPKDGECRAFAEAIVPVLKEVMGLRRRFGNDPKAYRRAAVDAAKRLHSVIMSPARHPDVQKIQDVFRDARLQCWQWLVGPEIPAENNRSEREVRPLATARKSRHGSQSDRGAETRGVFMSILHTLDAYAADKSTDMFEALFGGLDLSPPKLPRRPLRKLPKAVAG